MRKSGQVLFLIIFCLSLPPTVYADGTQTLNQIETSDLMAMSIEDLMHVEVVSASKKAEAVSDAPASVFIITKEDIRRFGYRTMADALRQVVGLFTYDDYTYYNVGVRGFARPDDFDSRVLFLIDGHRVNSVAYDSASIGETFPLDIENIERIEVVKGPGSALWGTNALLAVVNVITRSGEDIDGCRMSAEYGSLERRKGHIEYGTSSPHGLDLAFSYSNMAAAGNRELYFEEYDDPSTNNGIAVGLDAGSADRAFMSASLGGLEVMFSTSHRYKKYPVGKYGTVFNAQDPFTYVKVRQTLGEVSYKKKLSGNGAELLCRVYGDEFDYRGWYVFDLGYPTYAVNMDSGGSKTWGAEVRYSQDVSKRLSAILGMGYQKADEVYLINYYEDPYYFMVHDVHDSYDMRSYYLQADYAASDSLKAVAGIRLDNCANYGSVWSPRGALVYSPSEDSTFKFLYGRAFLAPNDFQRAIDVPGVYAENLELTPETINTLELVWEQRLGKSSRLATSVFRFDMDDIITQTVIEGGELQFQNLGSVRSEGVEVQLESRSPGGQISHVGATVLNARDMLTEEQLTASPSFQAFGGFSFPVYSRDGQSAFLAPQVRFISGMKMRSGEYTPAAAIADIVLYAQDEKNDTDVSFGVYNLFDTPCYVPTAPSYLQQSLPQEGRTIRLQINKRL